MVAPLHDPLGGLAERVLALPQPQYPRNGLRLFVLEALLFAEAFDFEREGIDRLL